MFIVKDSFNNLLWVIKNIAQCRKSHYIGIAFFIKNGNELLLWLLFLEACGWFNLEIFNENIPKNSLWTMTSILYDSTNKIYFEQNFLEEF